MSDDKGDNREAGDGDLDVKADSDGGDCDVIIFEAMVLMTMVMTDIVSVVRG